MSENLAFRATYADWKLIKTRGVVQVVMEVPLSDADAAYGVLGGMPNPANETWFGIAPISIPVQKEARAKPRQKDSSPSPHPGGARRSWQDIPPPQQAGIRCEEPVFEAFLKEQYPEDWREAGNNAAECVRLICAVESRSQLAEGVFRVIWHQLDTEYQAWLAKERVGA
jgi:hypothetical protein